MSAIPVYKLTLDEYLELDRTALDRYEYFDGEVFAMAGGSPEHTRVGGNVFATLREKLRGTNCEAFTSDLRVKVPAALPYRYPDVSAVCGEAQYEELQGVKLLLNPVLLVEVLSTSTAGYDLGEKFTEYKSIPSFREYLVVSQTRPFVIRYFRHPNGFWVRYDIEGIESEVQLESLHVTLQLSEIYERMNFAEKH
jgi:Uma2 family endonuclease